MIEWVSALIEPLRPIQHGFHSAQRAADELFARLAPQECRALAGELFAAREDSLRMVAVFLLGRLAAATPEALEFLRRQVSPDPSWRVQEILAKAFDGYCADLGYAQAAPLIHDWLCDPHPNVRRAASEGLRIWTARPYFADHPEIAVAWLGRLHADESEYVRKSAGNALRDISRKHPDLVRAELAGWDLGDRRAAQTYRLAAKRL